jgi:heme/copper-type cytochrome/quinol oxidase subunit 4
LKKETSEFNLSKVNLTHWNRKQIFGLGLLLILTAIAFAPVLSGSTFDWH